MNSALAPYLEQLLYTNDTVVIPGLGAFVAQPAPSTIDYAGGAITPPSKSLSFNENLTTDDGLLTYAIVNDKNSSDEEARLWIEERVAEIHQNLNQREIIALAGIGRLYKNYVQKIQFLPDAANFSRENFGLPPIQFSPLSRSREVTEPGVETSTTPANNQQPARQETATPPVPFTFEPSTSDRLQLPRILVTVLLLALSGMVGYWLLQRQKIARTGAVQPPTETSAEAARTTEPPEEQSVVPAPSTAPKSSETKVEPKKTTPPPVEKADSGKEGIVVLGLFKDQDNIARLKKQIQSNGYGVYSVPGKNGAETVGAKFNYSSNTDLQARLKKLEQITGVPNLKIKK
jgi:hypothetical protein